MESLLDNPPALANNTTGVRPKEARFETIDVNGERVEARILESSRDWESWYGWLRDLFIDRDCWSLLRAKEHIFEEPRHPRRLVASRHERNEYMLLREVYDEQQIRFGWAKDVFRGSLSSDIRLEVAEKGYCNLEPALHYLDCRYNPASRHPLGSHGMSRADCYSRPGWPYRSDCRWRCPGACRSCPCRPCSMYR